MKTIGIDQVNSLVYEGSGGYGHAIWPTPEILPASIVNESENDLTPKEHDEIQRFPYIFLDDGYDPNSRIRKGRIYEKNASQPINWNVQVHPAMPSEVRSANAHGVLSKPMSIFYGFNFWPKIRPMGITEPLIILGSNVQFTIWSVVDVETSVFGESILYLKARKMIGALPKVNYSAIDAQYHAQIKEKLNLLAEDIYRAGPDSVVDRAREAASAIINAFLIHAKHIEKDKDLGQLVSPLKEKAEKYIAANCADTLAKLHSRSKHAEQSNKGLRPINNQDAELAVQSVGMILIELDWAHW